MAGTPPLIAPNERTRWTSTTAVTVFAVLRAPAATFLRPSSSTAAPMRTGEPALSQAPDFRLNSTCNLACVMCDGLTSSRDPTRARQGAAAAIDCTASVSSRTWKQILPHVEAPRILRRRTVPGEGPRDRIFESLVAGQSRVARSMSRRTPRRCIPGPSSVLETLKANIIVSIDSVARESYERIRVNADFDEVMRNVDYLREYTTRRGIVDGARGVPDAAELARSPDVVRYCNDRSLGVVFQHGDVSRGCEFPGHGQGRPGRGRSVSRGGTPRGETTIQRANDQHYSDLIRQVQGYRDRKAGFSGVHRAALPGREWTLALHATIATVAPMEASGHPLKLTISGLDPARTPKARAEFASAPIRRGSTLHLPVQRPSK